MGKWGALLIVGCVAVLAPATVGFDAVGAVVGLARPAQTSNSTVTTSFQHATSTQRVDLDDAPASECEFPGVPSTKVDETSAELEPVVTLEDTIGPGTIIIGDRDNGGTAFEVLAGTTNVNVNTLYETVVTQYFQATAAGEACAVVAAARFTA